MLADQSGTLLRHAVAFLRRRFERCLQHPAPRDRVADVVDDEHGTGNGIFPARCAMRRARHRQVPGFAECRVVHRKLVDTGALLTMQYRVDGCTQRLAEVTLQQVHDVFTDRVRVDAQELPCPAIDRLDRIAPVDDHHADGPVRLARNVVGTPSRIGSRAYGGALELATNDPLRAGRAAPGQRYALGTAPLEHFELSMHRREEAGNHARRLGVAEYQVAFVAQ